ncbi:MFS general substrate transporter [Glonium stellatum]|uniref:MFS general substrate transporter n=1 Tax=Glonium stellatum TaxID=574774 RepID=A0A8E2JXW2_9PEZI|nr:MFS general substrate transporter [Glonium stellatum]
MSTHSSLHTDSPRTLSEQQNDDLDEIAPLLLSRTRSQEFSVVESIAVQDVPRYINKVDPAATIWPRSARYLVFLCGFLTSLSFGVTQVPLLYVFRLMTCDAYYESHPSQVPDPIAQSLLGGTTRSILSYALAPVAYTKTESNSDRCSIHAIESSTALSVSLLGASTTVFGLLNLFLTTDLIKRIGVKPSLLIQVFFPAVRLLVQNVGVEVWGNAGIIIIQCSQIVSIIGGPSGYLLVLNTYITEVVEYEGRTVALGRLAGSMMFGSALGFLSGGVVAEVFGIKAPFRLTLMLFLISCAYVAVFLPNIPPAEAKVINTGPASGEKKRRAVSKFLDPLAVFAPRKFITKDGVVRTEYGAFLLAWGVFLGILATGYLSTLLQLYSTDVFGFGTQKNGWLIFEYSMLRGVFLTFAFPKLIGIGRKLTTKKEEEARRARSAEGLESSEREPLLTTQTHRATTAETDAGEDKTHKKEQTFTFDLTYTRFSLIADGLLTLLCSFVREGWQMYLVAAILPFAAGTGSAAKGTILQMVGSSASSSERTDALAGVSLVENMARLSTTFVFGVIFAAFASIGRAELVFTCNAAVALIGFVALLFARFPPEGSRQLDEQGVSTPTSSRVVL